VRAILRLEVDPAAAVGNDVDGIAEIQRIQHGEFDAVIGRQPNNDQIGDAALAQPLVKRGFLPMTVVKKAL
jgi:hypothetical protein